MWRSKPQHLRYDIKKTTDMFRQNGMERLEVKQ